MKNLTNKTKTILLASLIAAMILPFSSMNVAEAQNANITQIISELNGKCLDIEGVNGSNGANVIMWNCHDGANQKWNVTESGQIVSQLNGKCLDAKSDKNVIMWNCHDGANQKWNVTESGQIVSDIGMCLDIKRANSSNGANVIVWDCHTDLNQKWKVTVDDHELIDLAKSGSLDITELSDKEWHDNQVQADEEHTRILKEFENNYATDKQFAKAVDTIRTLASDSRNIDDDSKWNAYMSSLQYIAEKSNPVKINRLSSQDSGQLRELIRADIAQADFSAKIASDSVMLSESDSKTRSMTSAACNALKDEMTPYLFQPRFDVVSPANNGLKAIHSVMYDGSVFGSSYAGKCVLEINLVYYDEDSPGPGSLDDYYDADRLTNWGRIYDIETFYVVGDIANGAIDRFSYVNMWITKTTGDEKQLSPIGNGIVFNWNFPAHWKGTDTPKYTYNGEPIIFVNTFNHAMGEDYDASTMFPATVYDLDRFDTTESRPGVENAYSTMDYKSQYRVEYP